MNSSNVILETPATPKTPVFSLSGGLRSPSMLTPVKRPLKRRLAISNFDDLPIFESYSDAQYELVEQVGSGSFGTVWRAKHGNEEFAVKTFTIKRQEGKDAFARELAAQLFIEKTFNKTQLCSSAAVCGISAFIIENANQKVAEIVYPFVVAGDLGDLIENQEPQGKENSGNLALRINLGVDFLHNIATMHKYGIAHRDIKPENVLVHKGKRDRSTFIDFGSACFVSESNEFEQELKTMLDKLERQIGKINRDFSCIPIDTTLIYADPEAVMMDSIPDKQDDIRQGKKADIFAASVVLFELFLGKRVTEFIKTRNPLEQIKWKPNPTLLTEFPTKSVAEKITYRRLAMLIESMMKKEDSIDVYAEQLANIGNLLQKEIAK